MKDKELEIALNDDNTISFSDYINTRIAYETMCQEKDKEIERLNNIINEFEEWLENERKFRKFVGKDFELRKALNILQILKGEDKNDKS